jgi:hypothetical protein
MGTICAAREGNNTSYLYRETYRVRVNPEDQGKKRGSGKSPVRTRAVYLGTAEKILNLVQEKREPLDITLREFGLVAAAYPTAREIGLQEIFAKRIPGQRRGVPRWVYFFLTIVNRLDNATSKNRMNQWIQNTILPGLMGVDAARINGKNFWYAADEGGCRRRGMVRPASCGKETDRVLAINRHRTPGGIRSRVPRTIATEPSRAQSPNLGACRLVLFVMAEPRSNAATWLFLRSADTLHVHTHGVRTPDGLLFPESMAS